MMKIQAVKAAIQKHIDREETGIKIFNHLSKVFEKFENKKISERMATALRKNLPDDCERAYLKRCRVIDSDCGCQKINFEYRRSDHVSFRI